MPMDARTTARPLGADEYVLHRPGQWSRSIPYMAGTYAPAAQVEPEIRPDGFWMLALKTGHTIKLRHEGNTCELGPILPPAGLIKTLHRDDFSQ